jgi:hypothetical protein
MGQQLLALESGFQSESKWRKSLEEAARVESECQVGKISKGTCFSEARQPSISWDQSLQLVT